MATRGRLFRPTKGQRERVSRLRADGWTLERIARVMQIDAKTLDKHFAEELEHGADIKTDALLEYAERAAKKGSASAIRWLGDRFERAGAEQRPTTEAATEAKFGKKEIAQREAQNAENGTSWDAILKH